MKKIDLLESFTSGIEWLFIRIFLQAQSTVSGDTMA